MKKNKHSVPSVARKVRRRFIFNRFSKQLKELKGFMTYSGHSDLDMIIPDNWNDVEYIEMGERGCEFYNKKRRRIGFLSRRYIYCGNI